MPDTTRTFVALPIPPDRAAKLGRLQAQVAPDLPGARWVDPAHFHVTLAFLGDVANPDLDRVCRAVAEAAAGFAPLALRLDGLGAFPDPTRPRTVWAGVAGDDAEALSRLQKAIAASLRRAGYRPEDDRFHPHVTLGRLKSGRDRPPDATPLVARHRGWSAGAFAAGEVVTFASTLTPDGPEYTPLARAPLAGGKAGTPP
jgi:RNA 2',3'-cyclic 3'-phosphodiesterase